MSKTLVGAAEPPGPQPCDTHAERAVLGALLAHPAVSAHLTILLKADDFTDSSFADLFSAITVVHDRGLDIGPRAVAEELGRRPSTLSAEFVHMVAAHASQPAVALYYAAIVRDLAALRRKPDRPVPPDLPPMPMRGFFTDDDE